MRRTVAAAVDALRRGELVILPTETVYGLAGDAGRLETVAAIFAAKGRPSFNPLIAHVADLEAARRIGVLDARAEALALRFWPGPLTLVAPVLEEAPVCDLARAGLGTVALRAPAHPLAQEVLRAFAAPLAAPSANRSGRPSPTRFEDAAGETGSSAAAGLDGGPCRIGLESTVVSLLPGEPARLLRPGGVVRSELLEVLGVLIDADDVEDARRSPGRLAAHYAPEAPVRINVLAPAEGEAFIGFGALEEDPDLNLSRRGDVAEAAANLFTLLRRADASRPRAISVAPVPRTGLGEAVNDRLERAAGRVG